MPVREFAGARASTVLVINQGRRDARKLSNCEELAAQFAINLIEGKWTVPILRHLQNGPVHVGELKRRLSPISKKVLNQQLKQMANDALITRTAFAGKVPRVEYAVASPLGYAVLDLLQAVAGWVGRHYGQNMDEEAGCDVERSKFGRNLRI